MAHPICVLPLWQVKELEQNKSPNCRFHHHISRSVAQEMTVVPKSPDYPTPYFRPPIAHWVGPHHIQMKKAWRWVVADRWPDELRLARGQRCVPRLVLRER